MTVFQRFTVIYCNWNIKVFSKRNFYSIFFLFFWKLVGLCSIQPRNKVPKTSWSYTLFSGKQIKVKYLPCPITERQIYGWKEKLLDRFTNIWGVFFLLPELLNSKSLFVFACFGRNTNVWLLLIQLLTTATTTTLISCCVHIGFPNTNTGKKSNKNGRIKWIMKKNTEIKLEVVNSLLKCSEIAGDTSIHCTTEFAVLLISFQKLFNNSSKFNMISVKLKRNYWLIV